jgi:hypothetical protein
MTELVVPSPSFVDVTPAEAGVQPLKVEQKIGIYSLIPPP